MGWDDSLEDGTATHSSILAWRILGTEEAAGLQSMGSQKVGHDWATKLFFVGSDIMTVWWIVTNMSYYCKDKLGVG